MGYQSSVVLLSDRRIRVRKPRLRKKCCRVDGDVEIPAYVAMRSKDALRRRIFEILLRGASTRNYGHVISEMSKAVGISRLRVSRRFIEESANTLKTLAERRFDEMKFSNNLHQWFGPW